MRFICYFHKAVLNIASEKGNNEIVQLLLSIENVDVNIKQILK